MTASQAGFCALGSIIRVTCYSVSFVLVCWMFSAFLPSLLRSIDAGAKIGVAMADAIFIKGAREHNLKDIDVLSPGTNWWLSLVFLAQAKVL